MAKRPRKKRAPVWPQYMIEVTDKNRHRLEDTYGFFIPLDVDYIIPSDIVSGPDFIYDYRPPRKRDDV